MTLVGTTVGRLRVVEPLGMGGMGEVYVGYDETLKRRVALKAIRDERRLDPEARARFLREARILSQLDHPNICRLYELLEGDDGDFLVLELIAGESLKEAMERDDLDDPFKLHVAERVTAALVAAHDQGVAHRDLKPENVMLTPDGGVKVLDFGLAYSVDRELVSALGGEGGDEESPEAPADASGAPGEQPLAPTVIWSGEPALPEPGDLATTRSGARPRDLSDDAAVTQPGTLRRAAPGEGAAARLDGGPGAGSGGRAAAPAATFTGMDAGDAALTRRGTVMGTVAYMSPEQARGERVTEAGDMYSLGLLLQELFTGRPPYLEGQELMQLLVRAGNGQTLPVRGLDPDLTELIERLESLAPGARPTAIETAERLEWIRRKPGRRMLWRLAAVVVAALLFAGLKYTLDLRRQEQLAAAARVEAEEALEFLVDLFAVSGPDAARGDTITAKDLLDAGAARISDDLRGQPLSQARLMLTMGRVYRQLGLYAQAEPLLDEALAIRRRWLGDDHLETAGALDGLANLFHDRGEYERAEPLFLRALELRERALGPRHGNVAASLNNLAFNYRARGEGAAAEPLLLRALEIHQRRGGDHPDVARGLVNLGYLYRDRGDLERAEPYLRRALDVQERLPAPDPSLTASVLNLLAVIHLERGSAARAEPLFRRTLEILESVLGPEHPDVATGLNNLAEMYRGVGEYARAEPMYRRALAIQEGHPAAAVTLSNLADLHAARGEIEPARRLYERALAIQEEALGADHPSVAVTLNHRADLHLATGEAERAEPLYRRALAIQERALGGDHPGIAITLADLADLARRGGRFEEAEKLYLRAQAATRQALQGQAEGRAGRTRLAAIRVGLGRLYAAAGAGERAAESWGRAAALMEPLTAVSENVDDLHTHAVALLHLGRVDVARPMAEKLLARGWADAEFRQLCREHGLERPPVSAYGVRAPEPAASPAAAS